MSLLIVDPIGLLTKLAVVGLLPYLGYRYLHGRRKNE